MWSPRGRVSMRNCSGTQLASAAVSRRGLSVMPPGGRIRNLFALLILVRIVLVCQQASTTTSSIAPPSHPVGERSPRTSSDSSSRTAPQDGASEARMQAEDISRDAIDSSQQQVRRPELESSDQAEASGQTSSRIATTTTHCSYSHEISATPLPPNCTIPRDGSAISRPSRSAELVEQSELQIQAAAGQRLVIPCRNSTNSTRPASRVASPEVTWRRGTRPSGGGVALIVWHKDDQLNSPVFVADTRGGSSIRDAKQRAISDSLRGRARVDSIETGASPGSSPIVLIIDEARLDDTGLYTCTIEFDRAPTQMHRTSVVVLDPPKNLIIRVESPPPSTNQHDQSQFQTPPSPAGPYDEGSRLALVCEAQRGRPEAGQISWWQLESVSPIGPELMSTAAASSRSLASAASSPVGLANYLTTLSHDNDRDLYLGRDSFQQHQVSFHQLVGQLLASSNISKVLPSRGASNLSNVRLRHWRRVDSSGSASKTASAGAGAASQQIESSNSDGTISARLEIQRLTRENLANEFLCLASSSLPSVAPLNASLVLDLNLRPTKVRLVTKSMDGPNFRAGQKTMVECHAVGSKPSPVIRWFLGQRQIESEQRSVVEQHSTARISEFSRDLNNLTKVSYLTLTPDIEDNQLQLSCSAHNPKLQPDDSNAPEDAQVVVSDSLKLNVQFAPKLSLQLGAVIRPDAIKLGSDIFMDCLIEANPNDIQELVWLHEGQPLVANISAGVVITNNQSLVLRNIGVHQRGVYECRARNSLGQSSSNRLDLRPRHEPICDEERTKRRYEIALNQPTRIECHVLAEPGEDLRFSWRFNRSDGGEGAQAMDDSNPDLDVLATGDSLENAVIKQLETNFTRSSVLFTASSRRHFGQLLCSASNIMGTQAKPCSIQLIQSEVPEPVRGCFVEVHSASSFSIHCQSSSSPSPATRSRQMASSQSKSAPQLPPTGLSTSAIQYILELYHIEQTARGSERGPAQSTTLDSGLMRLRQPIDSVPGDYEDSEQDPELIELQNSQNQRQTRVRRLESELPSFEVADLKPNSTYNIVIYVQNQKGRSQATHHQVSLSQTLEGSRGSRPNESNHGGGQPELMGKRSSWPAAPSTSSQLLSFLRIDDLLSGRNQSRSSPLPPPLVAVALVVLLSTITLVMIVFFVNKLICSSHRSGPAGKPSSRSSNSSKRQRMGSACGGSSSSPTQDDDDFDEDGPQSEEQFVRRQRRSHAKNPTSATTATAMTERPATLRASDRSQGILVGSGSDTSRETNTDSTLVSSPASKTTSSKQTDSTLNSGEISSSNANWYQFANQTAANRYKRCSHGDLSHLSATNLMDSQRQCSGPRQGQYRSSTLTTRQDRNRLNLLARPASEVDDQTATMLNLISPQQQQVGLYGASRIVNSLRRDHKESALNSGQVGCQSRGTPQVSSVHSSECSSNNVDNLPDLIPHGDGHSSPSSQLQQLVHYNYLLSQGQSNEQQQGNQFDISQLPGIADSGVYVISDGSSEHHRLDYNGDAVTTGVMDPVVASEFWCQRVPNRLQISSGDHRRCHLIGDTSNSLVHDQHHDTTAHSLMLSNSFSKPISLVESVEDSRSSLASNYRTASRRLSSENLVSSDSPHDARPKDGYHWSAAASLQSSSSAYPKAEITPATPQFPRHNQQHNLMPPADFANDYQCYQKTISVPCSNRLNTNDTHSMISVAQKQQKSVTSHRVKFDTSNIN